RSHQLHLSNPIEARPGVVEAITESVRRLRDLDCLKTCLLSFSQGAYLGGSLAYGPYFSVRGTAHGLPASDLDLLVVLDSYESLRSSLRQLTGVQGLSQSACSAALARCEEFDSLVAARGPCVFSQKLAMWPQGAHDPDQPDTEWSPSYSLSLRFVASGPLRQVLVESAPVPRRQNPAVSVLTFRADRVPATPVLQFNM